MDAFLNSDQPAHLTSIPGPPLSTGLFKLKISDGVREEVDFTSIFIVGELQFVRRST